MNQPTLAILASGSKTGGGSGFENLIKSLSPKGILDAEIKAVISNHEHGGVRERADRLGVRFIHFPAPWDAESYQRVAHESGAEWFACSGWLKFVRGLDPRRTFNIHPALLRQLNGRFGGRGLYSHYVHEAVKHALDNGELGEKPVSGLTMHFVVEDDEYDRGPAFFEYEVPIRTDMTADEIGRVVNLAEHLMQPIITNMVVHEKIGWDGHDPRSLWFPPGYSFAPVSH